MRKSKIPNPKSKMGRAMVLSVAMLSLSGILFSLVIWSARPAVAYGPAGVLALLAAVAGALFSLIAGFFLIYQMDLLTGRIKRRIAFFEVGP